MRSRFISEPLAFDAEQGEVGSGVVLNAKLLAIAVAEIIFRQIAVKVPFAAKLVNADHAALENAEIALSGVDGVDGSGNSVAIRPFLAAVIHFAMSGKFLADLSVLSSLVGHQVRRAGNVGADDRRKIVFLDALDMERSRATPPFNEGEDCVLVGVAATNGLTFLAADESLVRLDRSSGTAHRGQVARSHSLSDAMAEEPSGFHAARQRPLNLVGRNAFLAGAHQVDDLKPKMQREMGRLKYGSLPYGEWLAAFLAIVKAKAGGLAVHLGNSLRIGVAAVRAIWASWPKPALDIRESCLLVLKAGIVESGVGHGNLD